MSKLRNLFLESNMNDHARKEKEKRHKKATINKQKFFKNIGAHEFHRNENSGT